MYKLPVFLFFCVILISILGCSKDAKVKPLRVGMELQYPPFEMADKDGNPTGVSVDIANEFGKYLGRPVEIQSISWTGLIPSIRTGKIDVIISSMSPTPERSKSVDFSMPYVTSGLGLLVKVNSNIDKFSDIDKEMIVAVKTGTVGDVFARKQLSQNTIRQFDSVSACVLEIVQERADVFIYDPLTLHRNHLKHPNTTKLILDMVPGTANYSAMAIKKGNNELLDSANKFIRETAKTEFFNKLGDKYLADIKELYKAKNIPFFFDIPSEKH